MNLPPWSYSVLKTYETCPYKAYRQYVLKDIKFDRTEATEKGDRAHKAVEERLAKRVPLPEEAKHYETFALAFDPLPKSVELKLGITREGKGCDFFSDNVWGRGKVDVVVFFNSHMSAGIYDWKTGKVREDATQLELEALLLRAKWPTLKRIYGSFIWLAAGSLGRRHELSDTSRTWVRVQHDYSAMEESLRLDHWPATQNPLCPWCSVLDCKYNPKR
jgi:hypothetical protein